MPESVLKREPFPYESNVHLIRQVLVPYPLDAVRWARYVEEWKSSLEETSLLEWIVLHAREGLEQIHQAMEEASGSRWEEWQPVSAMEEPSAEEQLLEDHGFTVINREGSRQLLAGGPDFPPALEKYLGSASLKYEWVLVSPLREGPDQPGAGKRRALQSGSYHPTDNGRTLQEILREAPLRGASDLHFECFGDHLRLRMRQQSRMITMADWKGASCSEIMDILKRWANLSNSEMTLPQDGMIDASDYGGSHHFRASHVKAVNGESIVLRTTAATTGSSTLATLGLPGRLRRRLVDCLLNESGLILVTGSTCSGKTTTACALLSEKSLSGRKILTIEDPPEWELPSATQSAVNAEAGWTFERALEAYLRQDPDILLIGEIRDAETARMACRAAMTGHPTLATLHARSLAAVPGRFHGWGLSPRMLEDTLVLAVHQKLKRVVETGKLKAEFTVLDPRGPAPSSKVPPP